MRFAGKLCTHILVHWPHLYQKSSSSFMSPPYFFCKLVLCQVYSYLALDILFVFFSTLLMPLMYYNYYQPSFASLTLPLVASPLDHFSSVSLPLPLVPSPLDHFSSASLLLSLVLLPLDYFSSASLPLLPVLSLLDHFSSVSLIQHFPSLYMQFLFISPSYKRGHFPFLMPIFSSLLSSLSFACCLTDSPSAFSLAFLSCLLF